jgi:hypothetical protein
MELFNSGKVFHDRFPLEITGLTEAEIRALIIDYCNSKGRPIPDEYSVKVQVAAKKAKNEKKAKREKKSSRLPRRG